MPYCLCKHGPNCERYREGICGFLHNIGSVTKPHGVSRVRSGMAVDVSECVARENNIGRMFNLEKLSLLGTHPSLLSYDADELSEFWPVRF